jgi:hypothetical protein
MGRTNKNGRRRRHAQTRRHTYVTPKSISEKYMYHLKKLYPLCKYDENKDFELSSYSNHRVTYGEMTYEGIQELYKHVLSKTQDIRNFLDVGSGRGKLCLYMAEVPTIISSVGVELVKSRFDDAEIMKSALSKKYSTFVNKVLFKNEDFLQLSLDSLFDTREKTFVWFSNLCFNPEITTNIFEKLAKELSSGSIICCSNIPDKEIDGLTQIDTVMIPMSWSQSSSVKMFKVLHN